MKKRVATAYSQKGRKRSMDTIKLGKTQTKMVAHRGLSGLERENTNAAFVAAGNRSYFGIETDVHRTKDGKYVVIHDETTKEVSHGTVDVNVEESDYAGLKEICLPDLDASTIRQDIRIPMLEEYIHICKKYGKAGVLELKNGFSEEELQEVVRLIEAQDYLGGIIFISFCWENCTMLRKLLPDQPIQWLTEEVVTKEQMAELVKYGLDVDIEYTLLTEEMIGAFHANKIRVNCWTCDDKEAAENLIRWGIDYITTNILE